MIMPKRRLGDICEVTMGQAPEGASYNTNGDGLPLVAGAGDLGDLVPKPNKYTTAASKLSNQGDIILCIRATIGDTNWSDQTYCLGRGVAGLRAKPNVLDQRFLWHFISARRTELEARGTGSTFKQVSRAEITEWLIPTPTLSEQQRIAAVLDKADSLRRKRQEAIHLGNEFLRAVFHQRFATKPRSSVLTDYCDFLAGFAFKSDQYIDPGDGVRLLRGINVGIDRFEWGDSAGYPKSNVIDLDRYRLEEGDVVLAMDRPWISTGLKCAAVDAQVAGSYLVQRVARLRPKQQGMSAFIMNCLLGDDFKSHCRITETTIPHISPKDFATFAVPTVSEGELSHFADLAAKVQRIASKAMLASVSTEELIASLQEAFFNTH